MRLEFKEKTNISKILKFNTGVNPIYGKGTMKGAVWCCNKCVGNILLMNNNQIVGWLDTECDRCGNEINWSEAYKYL